MNAWIEATRPRTLPVSIAGVFTGYACALYYGSFNWKPALICLIFALLAQISSNFANEYFDYRNGIDQPGREGFRRGVTEGDISPTAMKTATFLTLFMACITGLCLIPYGGWWLIGIGAVIAVFALAYSGGPWPLSQHGLGDLAVLLFYGIIPVCFTAWLQTGTWDMWPQTYALSMAIGLMGVNVLIVNNYRDAEDDEAVGKRTSVVIFGKRPVAAFYLANTICAAGLVTGALSDNTSLWTLTIPAIYLCFGIRLYLQLIRLQGAALNKILKFTALSMLAVALALLPAMGCR